MLAARATPALLTIRLARPWSSTTRSAQAYTAPRSATSTWDRARCAPRRASSRASARPMPEPAPVTAATRPVNVFMLAGPSGGDSRGRLPDGIGEHHGVVFDAPQAQGPVVAQVTLVDLPRGLGALLGEAVSGAQHVTR